MTAIKDKDLGKATGGGNPNIIHGGVKRPASQTATREELEAKGYTRHDFHSACTGGCYSSTVGVNKGTGGCMDCGNAFFTSQDPDAYYCMKGV